MNCSGDLKGLFTTFIENCFDSEDEKDGMCKEVTDSEAIKSKKF